jgi:pentatricopeptide repeat protein
MFNVFIEKRVYASGSDHDHVLFDESMDAKANRSALRLHKRPTPFLDDKRHAFTHTHVALAPSEEGLPPVPQHPGAEGDGGTRSFPKLDPLLFGKPRAVRSLVSGNLLHQAPGGRARCHSVGHGAGLSQSLGALHKHAPLALSTDRLSSACSPGKEGDADMRESIYGMWFCLHLLLIQDLQALRGSSSSSTPRTSLASTPRETPRSNGSSGAESGAGQRGGTGSKDTEQATEARRLMHLAMCVLRRMQHLQLRVGEGVYRALIEASGRAGCHQQAVALLEEMQERGLRPDAWVYGCLITAVADSQECVTPQVCVPRAPVSTSESLLPESPCPVAALAPCARASLLERAWPPCAVAMPATHTSMHARKHSAATQLRRWTGSGERRKCRKRRDVARRSASRRSTARA